QVAVWTLGTLGGKTRELGGGPGAVKGLLKLLGDKDLSVRQLAVAALGKIGLDDKAHITALAAGLKDSNFMVRGMTVEALSQYSHDEAPEEWRQHVIGHVAEALKDKDRRVQNMAGKMLI